MMKIRRDEASMQKDSVTNEGTADISATAKGEDEV